MRTRSLLAGGALGALLLVAPAVGPSGATPRTTTAPGTPSKCVSTAPTVNGRSVLPTLAQLGVRVWQGGVTWGAVAPKRPKHPTDPRDPAYHWPAEIDRA